MDNYTENQIEEKLKNLASTEPDRDSFNRMEKRVRGVITRTHSPAKLHGFIYYAAASAAVLLIGIGLLYDLNPAEIPSLNPDLYTQTEHRPTLAKLNAVFEEGGHEALDDYFEMAEQHRQPRADAITLQQIMTEL